jgi:hypothetical protein
MVGNTCFQGGNQMRGKSMTVPGLLVRLAFGALAIVLCALLAFSPAADAKTLTGSGGWTAVGTYRCTDDGFPRVDIGSESLAVPITCDTEPSEAPSLP